MVVVGSGILLVTFHMGVPDRRDVPPDRWPQATQLQRAAGASTIIMAAHPWCPCTRASLEELNLLLVRYRGRVNAYVLFLSPSDVGNSWDDTDTRRRAREVPGLVPVSDRDGAESRRFRLGVSGQIAFYDNGGRLRFHGGITAARGHGGPNAGRARVASLLERGTADGSEHPVFGCALSDPDDPGGRFAVQLPDSLASRPVLARGGAWLCGSCHVVRTGT